MSTLLLLSAIVMLQSAGKKKNEFIRFGKKKNEFIRFGKRADEVTAEEVPGARVDVIRASL